LHRCTKVKMLKHQVAEEKRTERSRKKEYAEEKRRRGWHFSHYFGVKHQPVDDSQYGQRNHSDTRE
jgi:hypothetical protein